MKTFGDQVIVMDRRGQEECRGVIVGVHRIVPPHYDIQPFREQSMTGRVCGIPESRLRAYGLKLVKQEEIAI